MKTAGNIALILCPLFLLGALVFWAIDGAVGAVSATLGILALVSLLGGFVGNLETLRQTSARTLQRGTTTTISVIAVVMILVMIDFIARRHNEKFDLTENQRFSLSPQTVKILENLEQPVEAIGFFQTGNGIQVENLLSNYRDESSLFTFRIVNPDADPAMAQRFEIDRYGTVVFVSGDRQERITATQEKDLTNAIVKVTREGKKKVYHTIGHGELSLERGGQNSAMRLKTALEESNYEVAPLDLGRTGEVPDDADLVVVLGPQSDFLAPEIETLRQYVLTGGRLFVAVNPTEAPSLRPFLEEEYGIIIGEDYVLEFNPLIQLFGGNPQAPIISEFEPHDITRPMSGGRVILPSVSSVTLKEPAPAAINVQTIASTGPESWGETNIQQMLTDGTVQQDAGVDLPGPVSVAAVVQFDGQMPEDGSEAQKSRVVVIGDSDFVSDQYFPQNNNADLFLNSVAFLAEEEDTISIRAKEDDRTPLFMYPSLARLLFILPIIVNPALPLLVGIGVVVSRRRLQ